MVDYYRSKREAYDIIDRLVEEGTPVEKIYFIISSKFCFGKKIVDNRIAELKEFVRLNNVSNEKDKFKSKQGFRQKDKRNNSKVPKIL